LEREAVPVVHAGAPDEVMRRKEMEQLFSVLALYTGYEEQPTP